MTGRIAWRGAAAAAATALGGLGIGGFLADAGTSGWLWILVAVAIALAAGVAGYLVLRNPQRAVTGVTAAAARLGGPEFGGAEVDAAPPGSGLPLTFQLMSRRVHDLFDEARAEHARLEAVFDASTDGMVALSDDTTVRFANPAAMALLGADPANTAVGRPLIESARDYELDGLVRRVARSGEAEAAVIVFGPGRVQLRAAAVPVPAGGDWSVLLMLADLTEVNRIDQMRRDFVSNVSHELRTPLASIKALAETLEDGVDSLAEASEFSRRIGQQVDRLTALVNELLDLSRIESGAVELRPEEVSLSALCAEAVALLATRAEQQDVKFALDPIGETALTVEADRAAILRAVSNLCDNAIKYSPRGSTIHVSVVPEGDLAAVMVRDEGSGISPHDLPRVFERFYKGDASRATAGVGLGLAIVKHIVRQHGGTVEAKSEPGEGATFTIRLPERFVGRSGPRTGASTL